MALSQARYLLSPKKNLPAGGTPETHTLREQVGVHSTIFKRMVPVDYSYQSKTKEVSGIFYFICPVTALPVSYRIPLTLCTALSTSPPGHPGLPARTCICEQVGVHSTIFKRMVPVDYSYQSKTKEVSGIFYFICPVTALPVSYRIPLTLCTALSTSPPGHPGLPARTCICLVGHLPVELNVLFILVLRR